MSTLLSPSESLAFNGFLSSVDFGDVLAENSWSAISESVPVPTARGREALSKATKDLMSLETDFSGPEGQNNKQPASPAPPNSAWPSFPGEQEQRRPQQNYTYGFGSSRPSSRPFFHSPPPTTPFGGSSHSQSQSQQGSYSIPRARSPSTLNDFKSSSPFFPSTSEASSQGSSRPGPFGASSAKQTSSSKRAHPAESDGAASRPSGASAKRRRPQEPAVETKTSIASSSRTKLARSASTSSTATTVTASQQDTANRPALLSPSQKRANHIQSEQKRRANIRRGYEALCEVVPALREAIRLEEEAARVEDESEKGRKRKRKTKSNGAQADEGCHTLDGRAGPKSENVVLQKTIDHLHGLLAERAALTQRLAQARAALAPGHPALQIDAGHLEDGKVPLWEREWNGGNGWGDDAGDDE